MKKIAIEFKGSTKEAQALARAVVAVLEASRLHDGSTIYVEGFVMPRADKWDVADPTITVAE